MKWFRYRPRVVIEPTIPGFQSDARRPDGPRPRTFPDPDRAGAVRLRRRVRVLVFYLAVVAGSLAALVGKSGYFDLVRVRAEREDARRKLAAQQRVVERQLKAIEQLENGSLARERIAREQLGLVRPGEIQFLLPRETESRGVHEGSVRSDPRAVPAD